MRVDELFDVEICKNPVSKEYVNENFGSTAYITTTSENNGVDGYTSYPPQYQGNVLTVSKDGASADAFYQSEPFCGNEKVMVLIPKLELSPIQMVFYAYAISFNKERFAYGRKCSVERLSELNIPNVEDIPKWISTFKIKPLTTKNRYKQILNLNVEKWKYVLLKDICKITMGNKMDASVMTSDKPEVNFVGRSADNNGVACKVDIVYDNKGERIEPYPAGCITVALGGSLGSTFLQKEPFYTSQNVSVLEFSNNVSDAAKLFICTLIYNESKYKYFPFGRELNTHIRTDYGFTIPVTSKNEPDWEFMENYMKSLPYGDRI